MRQHLSSMTWRRDDAGLAHLPCVFICSVARMVSFACVCMRSQRLRNDQLSCAAAGLFFCLLCCVRACCARLCPVATWVMRTKTRAHHPRGSTKTCDKTECLMRASSPAVKTIHVAFLPSCCCGGFAGLRERVECVYFSSVSRDGQTDRQGGQLAIVFPTLLLCSFYAVAFSLRSWKENCVWCAVGCC